jgi:CRISPR-associated protein Csh1
MLDTLIKIGKIQSEGKSDWDAKIYNPSEKTQLVLLIFDVDEQSIKIDLDAFDTQRAFDFRCMKPEGARAKNTLVTVDVSKNFEQLKKSLLGSIDATSGEFMEVIKRDCPNIEQTDLGKALHLIFDMKNVFENYSDTEGYFKSKNNVVATAIQSNELGISEPKALAMLDGFEDFAKVKILKTENLDKEKVSVEKVCYATGDICNDVNEVDFSNRFSLNKMFVTTTKNYLSDFQDGYSIGNYQVSNKNQKLLEAGSKFVLDNWQTLIANINHCILPRTFGETPLNDKLFRTYIKPTTDALFGYENIKDISRQTGRKRELYWITFMAYESDGNFFKTLNLIQDVNGLYLEKLEQAFFKTHELFKETQGFDWQRIMSYQKSDFNFYTLYNCIPVRKDKEKKNVALALFKSILEQRKIDRQQIFEYFKELVLCHRYGRYVGYKNIHSSGEFDFSLEKSVFQYLALIHVLDNLKLFKDSKKELTMENQEKSTPLVSEDRQQQIDAFFERMQYNGQQKGLFYLGQTLSAVAYAQVKKQHSSKPILNKINYNGMDKAAILKLHKDLREKIVQYKLFGLCEPILAKFHDNFDMSNFKLSKEEVLFYIMSGYSFRAEKEQTAATDNE